MAPTFPARLKQLREERKLTQSELAVAVGVAQSVVSDWERGRSEPVLSNVRALAAALKIKPAKLLD